MQRGGCHPKDGCQDGDAFAGAEYQYLGPTSTDGHRRQRARRQGGRDVRKASRRAPKRVRPARRPRPASEAREAEGTTDETSCRLLDQDGGGVKIGFIGVTLEGTPQLVTPTAVSGLEFRDEAQTTNKYVPSSRAGRRDDRRAHPRGRRHDRDYNECAGISGPLVDITSAFDDEIDVVVSGHTNAAYDCTIDGKLVTSAGSFGRIITDIDLTIDENDRRGHREVGDERDRHSRCPARLGADGADHQVQGDRGAAGQPRHRLDHRGHHPRAERRRRVPAR